MSVQDLRCYNSFISEKTSGVNPLEVYVKSPFFKNQNMREIRVLYGDGFTAISRSFLLNSLRTTLILKTPFSVHENNYQLFEFTEGESSVEIEKENILSIEIRCSSCKEKALE